MSVHIVASVLQAPQLFYEQITCLFPKNCSCIFCIEYGIIRPQNLLSNISVLKIVGRKQIIFDLLSIIFILFLLISLSYYARFDLFYVIQFHIYSPLNFFYFSLFPLSSELCSN